MAFPTETVYGLGANALDAAAVARIFAAKGRPAHQSADRARGFGRDGARAGRATGRAAAEILARALLARPLTLVVPKNAARFPTIVTAGLPTVGLRMPAHPVALALIRAAGVPIAAPSANRFTELSPTTAEHVRRIARRRGGLRPRRRARRTVGIESTVLSLVGAAACCCVPA